MTSFFSNLTTVPPIDNNPRWHNFSYGMFFDDKPFITFTHNDEPLTGALKTEIPFMT